MVTVDGIGYSIKGDGSLRQRRSLPLSALAGVADASRGNHLGLDPSAQRKLQHGDPSAIGSTAWTAIPGSFG